jgi:hypothetical protein
MGSDKPNEIYCTHLRGSKAKDKEQGASKEHTNSFSIDVKE